MWSHRIQVEKVPPIKIRNDMVGSKAQSAIQFTQPLEYLAYIQENAPPAGTILVYDSCQEVTKYNMPSLQLVLDWWADFDNIAYNYHHMPKVIVMSNLPASNVEPWIRTEALSGWRYLTQSELELVKADVVVQDNIKRVTELYAAAQNG